MFAIPRAAGPLARTTRSHALALPLLLALVPALLAGCSGRTSNSLAPPGLVTVDSPFSGGGDPSAFGSNARAGMPGRWQGYPLAIGNRWDYVLHARIVTYPDQGDPIVSQERARFSAEIITTGTLEGRDYFLLAEGDPSEPWPPAPQYAQRQDAEGFYEYDNSPVMRPSASGAPGTGSLAVSRTALSSHTRALAMVAQREAFERAAVHVTEKLEAMRQSLRTGKWAATEATPNELTLLRYPLRVGQEWAVRQSPFFGRIIVGEEEMQLPVGRVRAWRVRGVSELYGPEDRVHWWYGRAGLVRVHLHAEMEAVDNTGAVIGRAVAEFDQALARFSTGNPIALSKAVSPSGPR